MSSRNVYHTELKIACSLGLLDPSHLALIPRSSRYRFCTSDYSTLVGSELSALLHQNRDIISELIKSRKALAICRAIISIKHTLVSIHSSFSSGLHILAHNHRHVMESVVSGISRVQDITGMDKAASLFGISRSTFFSWRTIVSHQCVDSPSGRCIRQWPNQIRFDTVQVMRSLCSDPSLSGWPISSIAHLSQRLGIAQVSLVSWYKYSRLFGFSSHPPRCRKKWKTGVRAFAPNQIWHADVTLFRSLDGIVHYVYLVIDNFSRRILSWDVSEKLSSQMRLSTIRESWLASRDMIPKGVQVELYVDGGPENNNHIIDSFLSRDDIPINKVIAQVDVHFSNSMIEAANKLLKYRYLFIQNIPNGDSLRKHLEYFIPIYNDIRPHISLKGKTPYEAYFGKSCENIDSFSVDILSRFPKAASSSMVCTECADNGK